MSRGRVLIVDDDPAFLNGLVELLRAGHRVTASTRPAEALEILGRERFDVVLSDYQMPGMDGLAFLDAVKRRHPHCARVLMTAYADLELVVRALNVGEVHRFIAKPGHPQDFRRIVEEALGIARLLGGREEPARERRTVLLAHDSQLTLSALRMLLAPFCTVLSTGSGIEVLSLVGKTQVDALVTGVSLEHVDGCTITTYLKREKHLAIPVVIWGRGIPPAYDEYLRECGADLVLDETTVEAAPRLREFLRAALPQAGAPAPAATSVRPRPF